MRGGTKRNKETKKKGGESRDRNEGKEERERWRERERTAVRGQGRRKSEKAVKLGARNARRECEHPLARRGISSWLSHAFSAN